MRAVMMALTLLGMAGVASAQDRDNASPNGEIRMDQSPAPEPGGARKQAEIAIRQGLADPAAAQFRAERATEVASVKRGAFGSRIEGPVSIVCGQYNAKDRTGAYGGYAWFFVAIKRGVVLWSDVDTAADGAGAGYYGCKGAGLAS